MDRCREIPPRTVIEFDVAKNEINTQRHGLPLIFAEGVLRDAGLLEEVDTRRHYGEERIRAFGLVGSRLFVVVYTWRGERRRIISVRKANDRERKRYQGSQKP